MRPINNTTSISRRSLLKATAGIAMSSAQFRSYSQFQGVPARITHTTDPQKSEQPNVLFIAIDDLRPELGCYGSSGAYSPNIDRLAAHGVVFEHAYCQQALCGPSRASLLTGMRPDSTQIYTNTVRLRDALPNVITLPQHFQQLGYETIGISKIYHAGEDSTVWDSYIRPRAPWRLVPNVMTEAPNVEDEAYADGEVAQLAISELERLKDVSDPWFLGVGFFRPHETFAAPKRYWDLYAREQFSVPSQAEPEGAAPYAFRHSWSYLKYEDTPDEPILNDDTIRRFLHGYHACVSFVDALVGRLLDALDRVGLRDNTIVVLWGDNGIKLGEHGFWNKHSVFELDARVPLIVSVPGYAESQHCAACVELLDLFPTLTDLAGLVTPDHCEGTSLVPFLEEPQKKSTRWAYSQFPRANENVMGYSVRGQRWRYNEWVSQESGVVLARELYDHAESLVAKINLVDDPELVDIVAHHRRALHDGFPTMLNPKVFLPSVHSD